MVELAGEREEEAEELVEADEYSEVGECAGWSNDDLECEG